MGSPLWQWQFGTGGTEPVLDGLQPIAFSDIEGWTDDDHAAAFAAFLMSSEVAGTLPGNDNRRIDMLRMAAQELGGNPASAIARSFFEAQFRPYRVVRPSEGALVTGYFEPELRGSLERADAFSVPVYSAPADLVLNDGDDENFPLEFTGGRRVNGQLTAYYTRQEIEEGALHGRGLEICWLADAVDAFVMHVQGSGLVRLPDGNTMRLSFAGKNGHPYSSIGKILIERGELNASNASLLALLDWIRADPERGRRLMWENRSYIFFRRLADAEAARGPRGSIGIALSPGRSLAVDPRFHRLGMPIWVSVPGLKLDSGRSFDRLMIAQDTGSAIRGPVRGDIFWGTGKAAGRSAGATKHPCNFCILIPN